VALSGFIFFGSSVLVSDKVGGLWASLIDIIMVHVTCGSIGSLFRTV
jgi:hypothetical protein